jgi:protein-glutamine gamma-glutamyltransferase
MSPQPNRFFQLSLVFLVALNLVPHFGDYTVPTLAVGGLCLAWRLLYEFQVVALPNFITKASLVMTLTYLVYLNYGTLFGLEAGSALLICGASLKLIDRVAYRDAMVLLFLNFMLLLARFFESQTLGITIFAFFDLIITTALLVQLHTGSRLKFDVATLLKTGLRLTLQIAPFMILLFFVFPRFSTQFIRAQNVNARQSGFSDKIEPGSVSELAQVDQVAFRVRFNGQEPPMHERYWRGAVLVLNNGMSWSRGSIESTKELPPAQRPKDFLEQEILLEPLFGSWLFVLDHPVWISHQNSRLQSMTRVSSGSIFSLEKPHNKKLLYNVYSSNQNNEPMSPRMQARYLQGASSRDPRVLDLVEKISQSGDDGEIVALRLMKFYQTQFKYTLKPGKMQSSDVAEFLFDKREGFCEHFAASFANIMRQAGIPSRVVVGFQGGRKNELSDYYLVTSRDAHAWVEVWSDKNNSWLRFDPTIMVSPLRTELGGDLYHSLSADQLLLADREQDFQGMTGWLKKGFLAYDALSTNWNLFLLSYDKSGQQSFFARMGFKNVNQNLLLSISLLILLSFFLWVRMTTRSQRQLQSKAQKAYLQLRQNLSRKGLEKKSFEGPSDFLKRCQVEWPDKAKEFEDFRRHYLDSEYGSKDVNWDFRAAVRRLKSPSGPSKY